MLTKGEIRFLEQLSHGEPLFPKDKIKPALFPFICAYSDGRTDEYGQLITDGRYVISDEGTRYLLRYNAKQQQHRMAELREWITTVIAVLAFILSATSLLWQVYSWQSTESQKREEATTAVRVFSCTR